MRNLLMYLVIRSCRSFEPDLPFIELLLSFIQTEFGRTADENGSDGTDHGWARAWWVIGKGITGGFHGAWPGLDSDNIGSTGGRYMLNYGTDYSQILADLLVNLMPGNVANAEAAFPGFTYRAPLGFV